MQWELNLQLKGSGQKRPPGFMDNRILLFHKTRRTFLRRALQFNTERLAIVLTMFYLHVLSQG